MFILRVRVLRVRAQARRHAGTQARRRSLLAAAGLERTGQKRSKRYLGAPAVPFCSTVC